MNLFVSLVSVLNDRNGIPEKFEVALYSNSTVDGVIDNLRIEVEIPFNDSLSFSEIESLAVARARAFIAQ
jgi:hypothetical protein